MLEHSCVIGPWSWPQSEWTAGKRLRAELHEEGYCPSVPTEKVAQALRYLYESRPTLSLRAIGGKPEVGLRHDTVGKIRDAAAVVLGVAASE
jgi:hypothetical protein